MRGESVFFVKKRFGLWLGNETIAQRRQAEKASRNRHSRGIKHRLRRRKSYSSGKGDRENISESQRHLYTYLIRFCEEKAKRFPFFAREKQRKAKSLARRGSKEPLRSRGQGENGGQPDVREVALLRELVSGVA